jgi:hypothetical protein
VEAGLEVSHPVLLDASFLVALERETSDREIGPARRLLATLRGRRLVVSVVTVEEMLEGATDESGALADLLRFTVQDLHLGQARRCALLQRRSSMRLGENDAWLVATADSIGADVVGSDRPAFERRVADTCAFGDVTESTRVTYPSASQGGDRRCGGKGDRHRRGQHSVTVTLTSWRSIREADLKCP